MTAPDESASGPDLAPPAAPAPADDAAYARTLGDLFARSAMGMRPGLSTIGALLRALGSPQQRFPYVLVAGTNGKGSTSYLLAEALRRAGLSVGLFTSPHLLTYRERIVVDGRPIAPAEVVAHAQAVQRAEAGLERRATFFEATCAIACCAFAAAKLDIAVVEVGLGGLLDATNVLPDAGRRLSVITPIALDHQAVLGDSLAAIAQQKAGILRRGCPAVVAPQAPEAAAAIAACAAACGAPTIEVPTPAAADADLGAILARRRLPAYLQQNVATAEMARRALTGQGLCSGALAMAEAVAHFAWPGRYQHISARRPAGPSYLVDGGHNPAGIDALVQAMAQDPELSSRPRHAVFAALAHKDDVGMCARLRPHVEALHRCRLQVAGRPTPADAPSELPSVAACLEALDARLGPRDVVVVAGSLYLAGEALVHLLHLPADPPVVG